MEIIYKKVSELVPYINNARTHNNEQVDQICASINEYGFTNPLLIYEKNSIIAGHGRLLAAKKLKMKEVPCIVLCGLTEAQKKAYIIADNKLALNAGWDFNLLSLELENLKELDFDLSLTGFSIDEINSLLGTNEDIEDNDYEEQEDLKEIFPNAKINPIGDWTGGTDVDTGATNRKLGSDMADSITGGGLHGKDLSKADVSVNIYAFLKAQAENKEIRLSCAIGDEFIDGKLYSEIVDLARHFIKNIGGFEKFAEWGLF